MYILIDSKLEICDKSFKTTPQGYLMLDAIIARSGTQEYLAHELGILDRDPNRVIVLDRPANEVTHSLAIASFLNMPVTDEHPSIGQVNPDNFTSLVKGVVLDVEATPSSQVKASMLIQDAKLIKKIRDGKRELSAGYSAEIEFSDDGKTAIQRKIRGNHVAFVDAARCGKECSIFDSQPIIPKEDKIMAKMKINDVEYEVEDNLVSPIQKVIDDNKNLVKQLTDSKAETSKTTALYDAEKEKVKKMEDEEEDDMEKEKKIQDAADARLGVLVSASKFIKDYDPTGKSLNEIKRDVLTDNGIDIVDKDDVYVDARYDILVEDSAGNGQTLNDGLRDQMGNYSSVDINDAVAVARKAKIDRQNKAGEK